MLQVAFILCYNVLTLIDLPSVNVYNLDDNVYSWTRRIYLFGYTFKGIPFFAILKRRDKMNYGYQNEYDFVELFNGKYIAELDDNSQKFLKDLFGNEIDDEEIIKAWKNKMNQKADIFIKYKNYIKNISLKCGKSNSAHHESI